MEAAAEPTWLWKSLHPKLIDGFTFTMPDTPENQKEYPQQDAQAPGVGQPIARVVAILSLSTACILDAALGPYKGKQTGETSLLRRLLNRFGLGDVAVMDRIYCSYMMIVALQSRGAQVCARRHHTRHTDFRRGKRLGKNDHLIVWKRPDVCPFWMNRSDYDALPRTLTVRELRYQVVVPGRRTKSLTIITTLLDPKEYSLEDIAQLYGFRWNVELDIRSIKSSLNLEHVRCKSPEMVRREFWTTMLAYNLIRTTAASAALLHDQQPRQISFTATCQYVLSCWVSVATGSMRGADWDRYCKTLLAQVAQCEVANRPGRLEPRVIKKRPKTYKLMQKPREVLRRELRKRCT
jgi:putative transposase